MKGFVNFLLIGILAIACSKASDPDPKAALIGSWNVVSVTSSGCIDPADNGTETLSAPYIKYTFTSTTLSVEFPPISGIVIPTISVPYTVSGNTITSSAPGTVGGTSGGTMTFTVAGTTLTLTVQATAADGGCKVVQSCTKV